MRIRDDLLTRTDPLALQMMKRWLRSRWLGKTQPRTQIPPPATAPQGVEDQDDISKRRIRNNYANYKALSMEPGSEQIRLMHILPTQSDDDNEEIVCSLSKPPQWRRGCGGRVIYIALSYCWGDLGDQRSISLIHDDHKALDEHRVSQARSGSSEEDELPSNGTCFAVDPSEKEPFDVTASLYSALKSIRKATPRIEKEFPGLAVFLPIWVDALCINQGNVAERSGQVGMMGEIYSSAYYVWIWLGENEAIVQALRLIIGMNDFLCEELGMDFDPQNLKDDHIRLLFDANAKVEVDTEQLGPESFFQILEALFCNPYFKRIWVLQQATLNPRKTLVFVTDLCMPLCWIIVAERFQRLWRDCYPMGRGGSLPRMWVALIEGGLTRSNTLTNQPGTSTHRLGWLFLNTYRDFNATDPRDKLFALLDLSMEAQGTKKRDLGLEPDYSKTISQVFIDFTRYCLRDMRALSTLNCLCQGPRRLSPQSPMAQGEKVPDGCLATREHPSWALWPTDGRYWAASSLLKVEIDRGVNYNLASEYPIHYFDLSQDSMVPMRMINFLLSLRGIRIGVVKSILKLPLQHIQRSEDPENPSLIRSGWISETTRIESDASKHRLYVHSVCLTSAYIEYGIIEGGLTMLWNCIGSDHLGSAIQVNDHIVPVGSHPQEWLGHEGGRYDGNREYMFRDFIETLLLSPAYRSPSESTTTDEHSSAGGDKHKDEELPAGPWDDPEMSISLALEFIPNEPNLGYLPPKIRQHLLEAANLGRSITIGKSFPFLFLGGGKCFFITEDEHMGMCSPDVEPGDLVVALFGCATPFILRPMADKPDGEVDMWDLRGGAEWDFQGADYLKKTLFRFMGECYLHERMTSQFLDEASASLPSPEIFNIC